MTKQRDCITIDISKDPELRKLIDQKIASAGPHYKKNSVYVRILKAGVQRMTTKDLLG